jgi:hypothetical protein
MFCDRWEPAPAGSREIDLLFPCGRVAGATQVLVNAVRTCLTCAPDVSISKLNSVVM